MTVVLFGNGMTTPKYSGSFNPFLIMGASGWFTMTFESMPPPTTISKKVFIIRTAKDAKYVKLQFIDIKGADKTLANLRFKWDYISDKGKNDIPAAALRENELVIDNAADLLAKLKESAPASVRYLTIKGNTLRQAEINFIKKKKNMPALEELNLKDATIEVDLATDYGFKETNNIKLLILPKTIKKVGFGHYGYSSFEKIIPKL